MMLTILFDLADDLTSVMTEEDDAVSLFTNTPIEERLNIIRERLEKG